ncbi:hypothetical protein Tco_0574483 [Tanacetum coccineum]
MTTFVVCLNDRLKGIRMEYLPETFWNHRDKANARAMIQAIDKRLKTRRIMRSLEKFVGGRPYGDFRYSDTAHLSRSVKVLKLKNFKKDATLKLFKNGLSMSVQMSQVHKMARFIRWHRDCAWLMISRGSRSLCQIQVQGTSSNQEVNDHYNIFTRERQEYELQTKDKA